MATFTVVPFVDMMPSRLVVAWNKAGVNPLIRSLVQIAATVYRSRPAGLRGAAARAWMISMASEAWA